jgi:hypothetical protein
MVPWEIIRLLASPARLLGVIYATDEKAAIEEFKVTNSAKQWQLMVRRQMTARCRVCGYAGWVCEADRAI